MADVFISYDSGRRAATEHLKRIVEAHGFSVWYDAHGLQAAGATFRKQIERELRAASVVLVLWDPMSRNSDWVEDEARLAKKLGRYVPVRLAERVDLPLGLAGDHYVDLAAWDGSPGSHLLHPLFREIERHVGRASGIRRAEIERIDEDWRLYGAPRMLDFEIVRRPPLATPARASLADPTLPLGWEDELPPLPMVPSAALATLSGRLRADPQATLRPDRLLSRGFPPPTLPALERRHPTHGSRVSWTFRGALWTVGTASLVWAAWFAVELWR